MRKNNFSLLLMAFAISLSLSGCYAPVIEGAQQGYDATKRASIKTEDASPDDPVAQYKLGNTYCCKGGGPLNDLSIYDNSKATYWYCKSARRGYAPAQLQLARLYSGHAIRGLHVVLRASALVGNAETDLSSALMWASLAADNKGEGDADDAAELRKEIVDKATDEERTKSASLLKSWKTAACQWGDVFPANKSRE
jgi:TPR repeat protein